MIDEVSTEFEKHANKIDNYDEIIDWLKYEKKVADTNYKNVKNSDEQDYRIMSFTNTVALTCILLIVNTNEIDKTFMNAVTDDIVIFDNENINSGAVVLARNKLKEIYDTTNNSYIALMEYYNILYTKTTKYTKFIEDIQDGLPEDIMKYLPKEASVS